jgi:hypothetical protein
MLRSNFKTGWYTQTSKIMEKWIFEKYRLLWISENIHDMNLNILLNKEQKKENKNYSEESLQIVNYFHLKKESNWKIEGISICIFCSIGEFCLLWSKDLSSF